METLLWNLALCLFALFMPTVLFVYTVVYIGQNESRNAAGPLVLLNVFLALALLSTVMQMQLSTLTVTAIWGYVSVFTLYLTIRSVVVCKRVWRSIQIRLANHHFHHVDEEETVLQFTSWH